MACGVSPRGRPYRAEPPGCPPGPSMERRDHGPEVPTPKILTGGSERSGFRRRRERVCRWGMGSKQEDTMTLYIICGDTVKASASPPARGSEAELRVRSPKE